MSPTDKLTILFLAANPQDTDNLKLDEEMRAIDLALRLARHRDRFDLRSHWALRYSDLSRLLMDYSPHIVHFSGHGSATGEIAFSDEHGQSHLVAPDTLAALFKALRDNIRCVVLNACYSEQQAKGIAKSVDCVVGMKRAVADEAAVHFAAEFYQALGFGRSIATAFELGKIAMGAYVDDEEKTPKLLDPRKQAATLVLAGAAAPTTPASPSAATVPAATVPAATVPAASTPADSAPAQNQVVPPLRELKGRQLEAAMKALLAAYSNMEALTELVQFGMGENIAEIVGGASLRTVVFNLLQWAQMRGRLTELLQAAIDRTPDNPQLQEFIASLP
jgi:hypothetical protein